MAKADQDGSEALANAAAAAQRLADQLNNAGGAGRQAGEDIADGAGKAVTGWQAAASALADYAAKARNISQDIGNALAGAFQRAEDAIAEFVRTGKLDFRDFVASLLADLARIAARKFILGPIANALFGALGGSGGIFGRLFHSGGWVGDLAPVRMVPALAFAGAPRLHRGGWAGLRPDEVPAILQRGERVLSRAEVAAGTGRGGAGGVTITIDARGAQAGVAEQIDAKLRAAIPDIVRLAKASVADGRRRGHAL
jgi:hypothetical protein